MDPGLRELQGSGGGVGSRGHLAYRSRRGPWSPWGCHLRREPGWDEGGATDGDQHRAVATPVFPFSASP
jgi:hypothetical protein